MARTNNKDVHRGVVLYLDGKQVAANAKDIRAEMKKVKGEIDKMTVGSEEYIRATKRYRELDAVLQQHRAQLKSVEVQQQSMLSKGIKFFKDYSLQITGAIAAITGVAMKLNQFRKQAAEQEDAAANLKALTGLDDSNIQWLTEQAEKLSTTMDATGLRVRKSATEILEAYMLVGSAKPELLSDKEALNAVTIEAMRLAEAAKMDLKDAVNAVTTALNQFDAGADQAVRFVNVLAAGSKFGAANVQDQAAAIKNAGVAAAGAGLSIEELVGIIEMLGEKGIKAEEAGTALKGVFLKLQTGADDTNPAVVGLNQALENLAKKGMGAEEILKMFDRRGYNAAKILIDNTEKVKDYTEKVKDTNVAMEQAAINSDTTAAKMAQIRNQINLTGQELAKTLAPIFSKTVNWTSKFVMAMPAMIDFLKKWGIELAILAVAWNALAIKTAVATGAQKAWNIIVAAGKTIAATFRTVVLAMQVGFFKLTGSTQAATVAMAELNVVMKANVIGVLVTLGIALYEVITRLINRTRELTKEQKLQRDMQRDITDAEREGNTKTAETVTKVRQLSAVVHDNNRTLKDRKIALQELEKIVPGYHAELTAEGTLIKDNTTALKDYLDNLKKVAVQQALQSKMTSLVEAELNNRESRSRRENAERIRRNRLSAFDAEHADIKQFMERGLRFNYGGGYEFVSEWMKKNDVGRMTAQRQIGALLQQRTHIIETIREAEGWVSEADEAIDNIQKRQENLQKRGADIVNTLPEANGTVDTNDDNGPLNTPVGGADPKKAADNQKEIREAIAAVDLEYDAKANELKRMYLEGEIETAVEYAEKMQELELERLKKQLEIAGLEPAQREAIQSKIYDISLKMKEQLLKLEEDQKKEAEKAAADRLKVTQQGLEATLLAIRKEKAEEHMTEKEYNKRVRDARISFYNNALQDQKLSQEERYRLKKEYDELMIQSTEERNKEIEEKEKKLLDSVTSMGNEIGTMLAEFLTDSEKSFSDFMKGLVKTVLNTIEKLILAYIAETTARNVGELGLLGLAKAAAESAAITAAFETAKAAIGGGFQSGGYTGSGRWDEPRGIVHAGEFVANHYAVANDAVRPVLDLIDQAQKNGSIANLTAEQIAAVARPSASPSSASTVPSGSPEGRNARDPELTAAIRLLTRTTVRAAEAYQEPSPAYCWVEGRGSVNEAQALFNKMKSNASRKS